MQNKNNPLADTKAILKNYNKISVYSFIKMLVLLKSRCLKTANGTMANILRNSNGNVTQAVNTARALQKMPLHKVIQFLNIPHSYSGICHTAHLAPNYNNLFMLVNFIYL